MKHFFTLILSIVLVASCNKQVNQNSHNSTTSSAKPKLVVGIVIDQMRYDYLTRFKHRYGNGGFNRLLNDGFNLKNGHLNYTPTYTAVGHASAYTGTTPENHGIMGNDWYHKYEQKSVYCVDDKDYKTVGSDTKQGEKSPHRMVTNTIGDQLHLAQNMNGKVIGLSLKDRGAILPAGHSANAAYWYDTKKGKFITSTYYMNELPKWVKEFNDSGIAEKYVNETWNTYYDISTYTSSTSDDNKYEEKFKTEDAPVFPHDLKKIKKKEGFNLLKNTPQGNSILTDLALATIDNEKMGQGEYIDLLAVSYSATDGIGHKFAPNSIEVEDTYIRMDLEIEKLLNHLDKTVGKGNYTVFLTADHAVTENPNYLKDNKLPAGFRSSKKINDHIKDIAKDKFGEKKLIEYVQNNNIFLSEKHLKKEKLNRAFVAQTIADELVKHKKVYKTVTSRTLETTYFTEGLLALVQKGFNQKYSGDIVFIYTPSILSDGYDKKGGTTHGSPYSYDTHIPMLFYGAGINKGGSHEYNPVTNIAPTICALLEIEFTNGNSGNVVSEIIK